MNHVAQSRSNGFGSKVFWIAVAAIVLMLAWATAVFGGGGGYDYNVDGMPRPEGPFEDKAPGQPPISYFARAQRDGSILITRNGVKWITLANRKHEFQLSDPNGSGKTIVRMYGVGGHGNAAPVKLRGPVR